MNIKEICDLILKLNLYAAQTKKIHYYTEKKSIHELCDDVQDEIKDFADDFAEQMFGYYGKPKFNDFKSFKKIDIKETDNISELCQDVDDLISPARTFCNKNDKLSNIVSIIDDFRGKLSQFKFLATFDKISNFKNQ